jgi:hypothetical protein
MEGAMLEDAAMKVLLVLVMNGCRPGTEIATQTVANWFEEALLETEDCLLGLAHAAARGWVLSRNTETIEMTAAGAATVARSMH